MARAAALVLLGVLTLAGTPAAATHEVYFRYVVLGFVKDARGRAVAGRELVLTRDKTGYAYPGATDEQGFFIIVAQLGDESAGEPLTLTFGRRSSGCARSSIRRTTATPGHADRSRGRTFVERNTLFRATLLDAVAPRNTEKLRQEVP